jgi:hypothetical protein
MCATTTDRTDELKDQVLASLAEVANVAQFISFSPGSSPRQRFSRLVGLAPDHGFSSLSEAMQALLIRAPDESVNVRSFRPDRSKGSEFVYGVSRIAEVEATVRRLAGEGSFTIVNETVDIQDGGVSGVSYAGICEFAPGDTPRCVEKPGVASLPLELALDLFRTVYGFAPALTYAPSQRVEFSLHPVRRGYRREHTIIWEIESAADIRLSPRMDWPNRFSRALGDKAFGLLVAHLVDLPVPMTEVVAREIPIFSFGESTGTSEPWIRTCPAEPVPGRYLTRRGWADPYRLLESEDPTGDAIASLVFQEGVDSEYSGAAAIDSSGYPQIEGVSGFGDKFMSGETGPSRLPDAIEFSVEELLGKAVDAIGPVRLEWAHDGSVPWVIQMHSGSIPSRDSVIFPGEASYYHPFHVHEGIEALRSLVERVGGSGQGIIVFGDVGMMSHFGDVLRMAGIPSRLTRSRVGVGGPV